MFTNSVNIGYIQGINKANRIANKSEMLNSFNDYYSDDTINFVYENNDFSLQRRVTANVKEVLDFTYQISVEDPYNKMPYTYNWYIDDVIDDSKHNTTSQRIVNDSAEADIRVKVIVHDGEYYGVTKFVVPRLKVEIEFQLDLTNVSNFKINASLVGTGTQVPEFNLNDYTYQWYKIDISGFEVEMLEGENSLTLEHAQEGAEYKLIATNTKYDKMSAEGNITVGERNIVYVSYSDGNDGRLGNTPETSVKTMDRAYQLLKVTESREKNIIVVMGNYSNNAIFDSSNDSNYMKNAIITGAYGGIDYNASLAMYGTQQNYRYLIGDTTFQYMTWRGGNNQLYLYLQGYSLTMGNGVVMTGYATANTNQGLIEGNSPAVHILGGWLKYNYATLPRNNAEIIIKSGTYGRIILGGSPGTSDTSNLRQTTSRNFIGSNIDTDSYNPSVTIDIKNTTTASQYDYDVNLLVGGSACGNIIGNITENIKNGKIGRVLGASIGDSSGIPSGWSYPINTFIGTTTINMTGGSVTEFYGGCLGRNMTAIGNGQNGTGRTCDSYFYGTININISGGTVLDNIYGAGAGGVTGYSVNSSDAYKEYGENTATTVNINITGGDIKSNIYGGGYGYTEYLTKNVIANDGGALYGDSIIKISGDSVISGSIYAAGCGYNLTNRPNLAQMYGNSYIELSGSPTITGSVFGGGAGITNLQNMAKLIGNSEIQINADLSCNVFGGGHIAEVEGITNLFIQSGLHNGEIYGGGNIGKITGNSNVQINGGINNGDIYGGGNQATVTESKVQINNGTNNNMIFGGGNQATVETTTVNIDGGTNKDVFAGGNEATVETSLININAGTSENIYGGGNSARATTTQVNLQGGKANTIYGGSNLTGDVTSTNIVATSGEASSIYGGNNAGGNVSESHVRVEGGNITDIYGGNNAGGFLSTSDVNILGGELQNIYGGGNKAETTTSNVSIENGKIENIYGGGNEASVNTTNIILNAGEIQNVFGGSNNSGDVEESNINSTGNNVIAQNIFGGNNAGGITKSPNVIITDGKIGNVYGGGNQAQVPKTNVNVSGGTIENIYGGGNAAKVETDTKLIMTGGIVTNNVYGGGNEGIVEGNSNANIKDAQIKGSVYGGGNGLTAIVYKNSSLTIQGKTIIGFEGCKVPSQGCAFAGGNAAETGTKEDNSSLGTINVAGGKIYGNIYGGANTSIIYGKTNVNVGIETIAEKDLKIDDIYIYGTVFGGGEANASGSEIFDFSFISVTDGSNVKINGEKYNSFKIEGSIFGAGNASTTNGRREVHIDNFGTIDIPQKNISIQRANLVVISNSAIGLSGAKDRTNEYANDFFTISRVDELKLKNNSTLYLNYGANLLKEFSSLVDIDGKETLSTVTIDKETGENTKNVDNRIYMYEGRNLNIATNQQVTAYGKVNGMTFLGLYTNAMNPSTSTGFYNHNFENGEQIVNPGTFSLNSYVLAEHKTDHNIEVDGFYTNINKDGVVKTEYVGVTPEDDLYYMWSVGDAVNVTVYEITLTASKYATLGTTELSLTGFSVPNTKFIVSGFSAGLKEDIELVNSKDVPSISADENLANTRFALNVKSGKSGWIMNNENNFYTADGGKYDGNSTYQTENTSITPSLVFCFYNSQNLTQGQTLGGVKIRFKVLIPIDDLNYKIEYADVNITLLTDLFQDDYYEAAITPGEEFELFTSIETNITNDGEFSVYYSFYIPDFSTNDLYKNYEEYKRCIVSRNLNNTDYVFPVNTRITMLDLVTNTTYYYVVTEKDFNEKKNEYYLIDFIKMGSTDEKYDPLNSYSSYYNEEQDLIYENFIFHVNFSEAGINNNIKDNTLLMELQDSEGATLVGVLGIERDTTKYSVYTNKDAIISVDAEVIPETIYIGDIFNLNVKTNFMQEIIDSKTIFDTQYFNQKVGIKITWYDEKGNQLSNDSLLGIYFELEGKKYYPRIDGTTRIKVADRISNVLSKIKVDTSQNTTLATGNYTIKIETFGSSDGIYYGLQASGVTEKNIYVINGAYGLKVTTQDSDKIVSKSTGKNQNDENLIRTTIEYTSALASPIITVSLERRDYTTVNSMNYIEVDLKDYITNNLQKFGEKNEYIVTNSPFEKMTSTLELKQNLVTGTYKLVYKLYDKDTYIGEVYEYLIIR